MQRLLFVLAATAMLPAQFSDYWHQGKAEVCRYELERLRYGQMRSGYAVFLFVTEDLLRDKQVKDESGASEQAVNVLKLNRIERFATGLYDYSLMASVFTQAQASGEELPATLKLTVSVQDWCGHVWLQANRRGAQFAVTGHSYFEAEADENRTVAAVLLEDEVFTQIRLGAERLPVGKLQAIPGAFRSRLDHRPLQTEKATATLVDVPRDSQESVAERQYTLTFDLGSGTTRTLAVRFTKAFPFHITRFEERQDRGDQTTLLARGVLAKAEQTDYWTQNEVRHEPRRAELGLGPIK